MTKIKICGLSRSEDAEFVNQLRPDYVGFVFAQKSRRFVSYDKAETLRKQILSEILATGVFVDAPVEDVASLANRGVIDVIQLHGSESDDYLERLRSLTERPLVQAFRISTSEDVKRALASRADMILLDNGAGGTGKTFNWELIKGVDRPFFLAGGLGPENVAKAVALLKPYAVDVSSGVEVDGVKNFEKIRDVIDQVRKADALR